MPQRGTAGAATAGLPVVLCRCPREAALSDANTPSSVSTAPATADSGSSGSTPVGAVVGGVVGGVLAGDIGWGSCKLVCGAVTGACARRFGRALPSGMQPCTCLHRT